MYPCVHDTIQTILTSGQKESVISLMSFFVFGSVKPGFLIIVPIVPIAPIVSKNLPAVGTIRTIGAIIWKSLDRLESSQSSQTRGHAGEGLESVNLLLARNGFKMAARNRRTGLAAIYLIVLAVTR